MLSRRKRAMASAALLVAAVAGTYASEPDDPPKSSPPTIVLVEGQLTDHIGQGADGVAVQVFRLTKEGGKGELLGEAATDEMGDFSVRSERAVTGRVLVVASKPGFAELKQEHVLGEGDDPPFLGATLEGVLHYAGQVVSFQDDRPVPEASVALESHYREWRATTDAEGRFRIEGVSAGRASLVTEATGFAREKQHVDVQESLDDAIIKLQPERIVELTIVDDEDRPIRGATVELLDGEHDDFRTIFTNDGGQVAVGGLRYDTRSVRLRLSEPNHISSSEFDRELNLPEEPRSEHRLIMHRGGTIEGTVRDSEGEARNGARVVAGAVTVGNLPRDWSDWEGHYTLTGVPPGETVVTVHLAGFGPELKLVEVRPGERATADFRLRPGYTLRGKVVTAGGEPAGAVAVETGGWRGHDTIGLRAMTDSEGRFVIHDVPGDAFKVMALGLTSEGAVAEVSGSSEEGVVLTIPDQSTAGIPQGAKVKVGDPAPSVVMTTLQGEKLSLDELRGKVVLLDFWATWCGPCVIEIPQMREIYSRFGSRDDFVMIGISLDMDESALKKFLKAKEVGWHQVHGNDSGSEDAAGQFGANALPATFLINREGEVVAAWLPVAELGKKIAELLTPAERVTP